MCVIICVCVRARVCVGGTYVGTYVCIKDFYSTPKSYPIS